MGPTSLCSQKLKVFAALISISPIVEQNSCPKRNPGKPDLSKYHSSTTTHTSVQGCIDRIFRFMDDNNSLHRGIIVDECMQQEVITRSEWSAYFPDLKMHGTCWLNGSKHVKHPFGSLRSSV